MEYKKIAAECGVISERGEKQIAIISNDKGFQAVIDFFGRDSETQKLQIVKASNIEIVKASNIETALTLFSNPEDSTRRRLLTKRMTSLDLAEESAKIAEQERNIYGSIASVWKEGWGGDLSAGEGGDGRDRVKKIMMSGIDKAIALIL